MIRPLHDIEYLNYAAGQPYNIVVTLHISGRVSLDELILGFKKIQVRHPLLKVRIIKSEGGKIGLTSKDVGDIPIDFQDYRNEEYTKKIAVEHLNKPFDLDSKDLPLFRVTYLSSKDRSDLVLCSQHILADGLSMVYLVRDLVHFLSNPDDELKILDASLYKGDFFLKEVRKKIPKTATKTKLILVLFKIIQSLRYIVSFGSKGIKNTLNNRKSDLDFISWSLTEQQTESFLNVCKKNKVSVHSAVSTAFLPYLSAINNTVNLRKKLAIDVGESFDLYAGAALVRMRYRKNQSFWKNVRKYQKKLAHELNIKRAFWIHEYVHKNVPIDTLRELGPILIDVVANQKPFTITNLGPLDELGPVFDTEKLPIESFYGGLSFPINVIVAVVYTMRNKFHFHILYSKSAHEEKRIKIMATNVKETILEVINDKN